MNELLGHITDLLRVESFEEHNVSVVLCYFRRCLAISYLQLLMCLPVCSLDQLCANAEKFYFFGQFC